MLHDDVSCAGRVQWLHDLFAISTNLLSVQA